MARASWRKAQQRERKARKLAEARAWPFDLGDAPLEERVALYRRVQERSLRVAARRGVRFLKRRYHRLWRREARQAAREALAGELERLEDLPPERERGALLSQVW